MNSQTSEEKETMRGFWTRNRTQLVAALRILFGLIWIIDGAMKFVFMAPSDVSDLVQGAGEGQPAWLAPWFSFWSGQVSANPGLFLYGIGTLELVVGLFLVLGLMRKTVYVGGIALSLMIWAVDEGFGGPYGPGSTDVGAAVMYAVVFAALLVMEAFPASNLYSLDLRIERWLPWWRRLAEVRGEP